MIFKQLILSIFILLSIPCYAGTVNCDANNLSHCPKCPDDQKPWCDIVVDSMGPNNLPLGFCRCKYK